jgi:hypothetical protein
MHTEGKTLSVKENQTSFISDNEGTVVNGTKLRAVWDVFCPAGAWPKGSRKHSPGFTLG